MALTAHLGKLLVPVTAVFGLALAAMVAIDLYRRVASHQGHPLRRLEALAVEHLRRARSGSEPPRWPGPGLLAARVLAVVTALSGGFLVVRAGDTGARAVWEHRLAGPRGAAASAAEERMPRAAGRPSPD